MIEDLDLDGIEDAFLQNGILQAVLRLDGRASIHELDAYRLNHNFGDILRRQAEHYHRKIELGEASQHSGDDIASVHDRVIFKHEIAPEDLATDSCGRTLFADRWISAAGEAVVLTGYQPEIPSAERPAMTFKGCAEGIGAAKRIGIVNNQLLVVYRLEAAQAGVFETQLNLALPSCDGPAGRYLMAGGIPGGFGQLLTVETLSTITLDDDVLGGSLALKMNPPARFSAEPFFTVSQSEAGFEKIMQAVTIRLQWPVEAGTTELTVALEIAKR